MPVTPGSASKLNILAGAAAFLSFTSAEETSLATKVFPANILVKKSDGKFYYTNGTATVAELPVLIDHVLTEAEKSALAAAYSTGTYVRAANGVVAHNSSGKINDDSLNLVSEGKLVESYLSEYIDQTTHKVLLSALPDTVKAGVTYVATYADLASLDTEQKKSLAFVIDATDDPSGDVKQGAAMYAFQNNAWIKIAEVESLDLDVEAIECSYANVVKAGGVTTDMPIFLQTTATDFITNYEAAQES